MEFETKLRNYIISKKQKYFVRTTRLFYQANQRIFLNQQMIYWADKKFLFTKTEKFCCINKETQQKHFTGLTKQFCYTNNNKIMVGQAKPFSQCI